MHTLRPNLVRVATIAATGAGVAVLAACSGSSGGSASPSATPKTTVTQSSTVTTSAPSTSSTDTSSASSSGSGGSANGGSGGGSGGGPQANGYCAESQLRASIADDSLPTSGRKVHGIEVAFHNKSSQSCVLYGYPGAAIEDSSNNQVKQATRTLRGPTGGLANGTSTLPHVRLAPGANAVAVIDGSSTQEVGAAQAGCDAARYPRILVTPPNTKIPVPFTVGWPQCYSFQVHPVTIEK